MPDFLVQLVVKAAMVFLVVPNGEGSATVPNPPKHTVDGVCPLVNQSII
jgi:hypothetical protein